MHTGKAQRGFSYLGTLFLVTLLGAALAGTGQLWSVTSQRAKEQDLLWTGTQYARALRSYYYSSPGGAVYPRELAELLEDNRHPQPRRHLRRLYPDPMSGKADWGLIRSVDGGIAGVYSRSQTQPFKRAGFVPQWQGFTGMQHYSDWHFVAENAFAAQAGQPSVPRSNSGRQP